MHYDFGAASDIGKKRSQNQDRMTSLPDLGLFVVADGMGGHRGGETASTLAIETIAERVRDAQKNSFWNPRAVLQDSIELANHSIFQEAQKNPELQGMGTTTTALLFKGNLLTIGHVGDSRCYYLLPGGIWQATRDHSLVEEKLRAGMISRVEAKTDRMKNVITRSVGFEPQLNVDIYEMQIKPKDVFLICSDGLTGLVDDQRILETASRFLFEDAHQERNLQNAVDELIAIANSNGGDDNVTSIMIQIMENHG